MIREIWSAWSWKRKRSPALLLRVDIINNCLVGVWEVIRDQCGIMWVWSDSSCPDILSAWCELSLSMRAHLETQAGWLSDRLVKILTWRLAMVLFVTFDRNSVFYFLKCWFLESLWSLLLAICFHGAIVWVKRLVRWKWARCSAQEKSKVRHNNGSFFGLISWIFPSHPNIEIDVKVKKLRLWGEIIWATLYRGNRGNSCINYVLFSEYKKRGHKADRKTFQR